MALGHWLSSGKCPEKVSVPLRIIVGKEERVLSGLTSNNTSPRHLLFAEQNEVLFTAHGWGNGGTGSTNNLRPHLHTELSARTHVDSDSTGKTTGFPSRAEWLFCSATVTPALLCLAAQRSRDGQDKPSPSPGSHSDGTVRQVQTHMVARAGYLYLCLRIWVILFALVHCLLCIQLPKYDSW